MTQTILGVKVARIPHSYQPGPTVAQLKAIDSHPFPTSKDYFWAHVKDMFTAASFRDVYELPGGARALLMIALLWAANHLPVLALVGVTYLNNYMPAFTEFVVSMFFALNPLQSAFSEGLDVALLYVGLKLAAEILLKLIPAAGYLAKHRRGISVEGVNVSSDVVNERDELLGQRPVRRSAGHVEETHLRDAAIVYTRLGKSGLVEYPISPLNTSGTHNFAQVVRAAIMDGIRNIPLVFGAGTLLSYFWDYMVTSNPNYSTEIGNYSFYFTAIGMFCALVTGEKLILETFKGLVIEPVQNSLGSLIFKPTRSQPTLEDSRVSGHILGANRSIGNTDAQGRSVGDNFAPPALDHSAQTFLPLADAPPAAPSPLLPPPPVTASKSDQSGVSFTSFGTGGF